eukprot:979534_1
MSSSMEFFDVVETAVANAKVLEVMYGKVVPDIGLSPFDEIVKKRFPEERKLLFDLPLRLLISEKLGFYFFKLYLKNYHKSTDICQRSLLSTINFLHSVYVEYLHASSKVERTYLSRRIFKRYLRGVGGVNNGKSDSILKVTINTCSRDISSPTEQSSSFIHSSLIPRYETILGSATGKPFLRVPSKILYSTLTQIRLDASDIANFENIVSFISDGIEPFRKSFFNFSGEFKEYIRCKYQTTKPVFINDFRKFRILGMGSFGSVFAVKRKTSQKMYAMKEMRKKEIKSRGAEWTVLMEKSVLEEMASPFVVNLKYSFHTPLSAFFVLTMCKGGDLKFHLDKSEGRRFDNERAQFTLAEILLGLDHIHSKSFLYRDLKPGNVLLDNEGHACISDFGLSVKLTQNQSFRISGTPGYWSPECVQNAKQSCSSDWWSWGMCLY